MLTRSLLVACILAVPALASAEPRLVLSTDPLGPLHDRLALSATYAVGDHVALRADGEVGAGAEGVGPSGRRDPEGGLSVQLFLDRTYHGPYVEAGLRAERWWSPESLPDGGVSIGQSGYDVLPELLVGWQWLYHGHYSLAVALGGERVPDVPDMLGGPTFAAESYIRLGYAF